MNTITINDIKIEFRSQNAIYITKGDWVVYMDDSSENEKFVSHWVDDGTPNADTQNYALSVIEY